MEDFKLCNSTTEKQMKGAFSTMTMIQPYSSQTAWEWREGLIVQLPLQRNCSLRNKKSEIGLDRLRFLCYSAPWKDNQLTYFIVKGQNVGRKVSHDSKESVFLCPRFQRADAKGKNREIQVEFFDQPTCWRNLSAASIFLRIQIRKRMTFD